MAFGRFLVPILPALAVLTLWSAAPACAQDVNKTIEDSGAIFTYLLDTTTPASETLSPEMLRDKRGWFIVDADTVDHEFAGDAVLLNDAVALVIRRDAPGAALYALGDSGYTLRAHLNPIPAGGPEAALTELQDLKILENTPGAVEVAVTYAVENADSVTVRFRLATGQIYIETHNVANTKGLSVRLNSVYLVIPDFFADDLVYQAKDLIGERAGIPAENFLIHLVAGGNALVTCVWGNRAQEATAIAEDRDGTKTIAGSDVTYADGAPIWVSAMDRPAIWYEQPLSGTSELKLNWTAPFPARWRADFLTETEASESWNFEEGRITEYESAFYGSIAYPCWFETHDAYIRAPEAIDPPPNRVVIYPIDRTQGTPLDVFCLVDIMRATLGFGACQYVLDLEGLDAQTSPTPALVMDWVEKQFKAGRADRSRATIEDRLHAMLEHVTHADKRIKEYQAFARELIDAIGDDIESREGMGSAVARAKVRAIASEMERQTQAYDALGDAIATAQSEASLVMDAIGQDDALDRCRHASTRLHTLGRAQDRALSKGRMAVRRIAQVANDTEPKNMGDDLSKMIVQRASTLLGEKD